MRIRPLVCEQSREPITMLGLPEAQARFFEPQQARRVLGVLGMLIDTVGEGSLLGAILGQTRCEVASVLQDSVP